MGGGGKGPAPVTDESLPVAEPQTGDWENSETVGAAAHCEGR